MEKLPREFYSRQTSLVAKELLGHHLVYRKMQHLFIFSIAV